MREGARTKQAPSARSRGSADPSFLEERRLKARLGEALRNDGRRLTARQLASICGAPVDEVEALLDSLCHAGSVRRLATVIPSYTVHFR